MGKQHSVRSGRRRIGERKRSKHKIASPPTCIQTAVINEDDSYCSLGDNIVTSSMSQVDTFELPEQAAEMADYLETETLEPLCGVHNCDTINNKDTDIHQDTDIDQAGVEEKLTDNELNSSETAATAEKECSRPVDGDKNASRALQPFTLETEADKNCSNLLVPGDRTEQKDCPLGTEYTRESSLLKRTIGKETNSKLGDSIICTNHTSFEQPAFECLFCKKLYRRVEKEEFMNHLKTELTLRNAVEDVKNIQKLGKWLNVELHKRDLNQSVFPCSLCKLLFLSMDDLAQHATLSHKRFPCRYKCDLSFKHKTERVSHEIVDHSGILKYCAKIHLCQMCQAEFDLKDLLMRHVFENHIATDRLRSEQPNSDETNTDTSDVSQLGQETSIFEKHISTDSISSEQPGSDEIKTDTSCVSQLGQETSFFEKNIATDSCRTEHPDSDEIKTDKSCVSQLEQETSFFEKHIATDSFRTEQPDSDEIKTDKSCVSQLGQETSFFEKHIATDSCRTEQPDSDKIKTDKSCVSQLGQETSSKKYICEIESCGRSFSGRFDFEFHMTVEHQSVVFKCISCKYRSSEMSDVNTHYETNHLHCCNQCNTSCTTKAMLKAHVIVCHPVFKCYSCGNVFESDKALTSHMETMCYMKETIIGNVITPFNAGSKEINTMTSLQQPLTEIDTSVIKSQTSFVMNDLLAQTHDDLFEVKIKKEIYEPGNSLDVYDGNTVDTFKNETGNSSEMRNANIVDNFMNEPKETKITEGTRLLTESAAKLVEDRSVLDRQSWTRQIRSTKKRTAYVSGTNSKKRCRTSPPSLDQHNKALDQHNKALDQHNKALDQPETSDESKKTSDESKCSTYMMYQCSQRDCFYSCNTVADIRNHNVLCHMELNPSMLPYKCKNIGCKRAFLLKKELTAHLPECLHVPHKCKTIGCKRAFLLKKELTAHLRECLHVPPCLKCKKTFKDIKEMFEHSDKCHSQKEIPTLDQRHPNDFSLDSQYKCDIVSCNRYFFGKHELQNHMLKCHRNVWSKNSETTETVAPKQMGSSAHLIEFPCTECVQSFENSADLLKHINNYHVKKETANQSVQVHLNQEQSVQLHLNQADKTNIHTLSLCQDTMEQTNVDTLSLCQDTMEQTNVDTLSLCQDTMEQTNVDTLSLCQDTMEQSEIPLVLQTNHNERSDLSTVRVKSEPLDFTFETSCSGNPSDNVTFETVCSGNPLENMVVNIKTEPQY